MNTINNSRNPAMKMNIAVDNNQIYNEQNMQHNSLEHLNRSLNMHQMSAFSQNQSY